MTTDKTFTISEAARATGKSIPTIHAYLKANKLPNALAIPKGKSRSWQIPLTDLVAAGLLDQVESKDTAPAVRTLSDEERDELIRLRERAEQLEARVKELQDRVKDHKDFIKQYTNELETRATQEARRKRFRLWPTPGEQRQPILKDRPDWDSDRD
jgi:uncharacterized protein YlxW (UPF0749 family)